MELTPADHVVLQYLQTTNNLIETGRQVILSYLGTPAAPGPGAVAVDAGVLSALAGPGAVAGTNGNGHVSPAAVAPLAAVAPAAAAAAAPAPDVSPGLARAAALLAQPDELLARLVAIVAARTGYPADMLDPDLDVEADLSIDSIKRMEILAELADEIGLSDDGNLDQLEDLVEDLAKNKTLRSIVGFLVSHADRLTGGATPAPAGGAATPAAPAPGAAGGDSPGLAAAAAMLADPDRLLGRLVEIVAARTGYPADMLDPDLDVEADLSIDSIKRMEILAELADEIGLSDDGNLDQLEDLVEDLAKNKTLRSIVGFLVSHADRLTGGAAAPAPAPAVATAVRSGAGAGERVGERQRRRQRERLGPRQRPGVDRVGHRGGRAAGEQGRRAQAHLGRQHRHDQRHGADPALLLPLHDRRDRPAGARPCGPSHRPGHRHGRQPGGRGAGGRAVRRRGPGGAGELRRGAAGRRRRRDHRPPRRRPPDRGRRVPGPPAAAGRGRRPTSCSCPPSAEAWASSPPHPARSRTRCRRARASGPW